MSVNDEAEYPWLRSEKAWVRGLIENGVPVFGVCLGAQLIAAAMGAGVYPAAQKEIGWMPVSREDVEECFPAEMPVFHWHGETFDIPVGARRIASSSACPNQGFRLGRNVVGLQFHLEMEPESVEALVQNCADELVSGNETVHTAARIRAAEPENYAGSHQVLFRLLDSLV